MYILFHKKGCPYCAKVSQFMADQNIDYVSILSNTGDPSRDILVKLGGKSQVPFLVDVEAGKTMYESSDIVDYLKSK